MVGLRPDREGQRPILLARGDLSAGPGQEQTLAFDIEPTQTAALAAGDYRLFVAFNNQVVDARRLRFVDPQRPGGGGRWAHTMPHGSGSGFDGAPVLPDKLANRRYAGHVDRVVSGIHQANLWVNFFANSYPLLGPSQDLPEAEAADLPPAAAAYRPSHTHAFYQHLMAQGVALGITMGYGEDYRAEVYMPLPTIIDEQMGIMARKYLAGGLGAATLPNFVAAYTDYYGHNDWSGGGELSDDERTAVRQAYWQQGTRKAGMDGAQPPYHLTFDRRQIGGELGEFYQGSRDARRRGQEWLEAKQEHYGGNDKWIEEHYDTDEARLRLWRAFWQEVGFEGPIPEPERRIPLPQLDDGNAERYGRQAAYDYASFALRGVERIYGRITRNLEAHLPAVFTIHNKGAMNHSMVGHAWTGFRTPNVDPSYMVDGASAVSVSEWNLDGVPKPYFLPTFYVQGLLDRGLPVYQCGLWKQMGSPTRFLRDVVFWAGRGIQTYFDQTGNMTWSHIGADQTTYAANERMQATAEFHNAISDLVPRLEPVREVGLYVPAYGGPWGTGVTRGHYVAMIAALMSGYQTHMILHGDVHPDSAYGMERYPIIYAPSIHGPGRMFPFEEDAFRRYVAQDGQVVVSQAPDYYHPPEAYQAAGISMREVPQLDDQGEPRRNRDGSIRTRREWTATPQQWAQVTRDHVWGWLEEGVQAAPINVHHWFTHLDEDGEPANWSGRHWTGHHNWARFRGSALHQYRALQETFAQIRPPLVTKDQDEVFVDLRRPKDGADGWWLFASNWTLPGQMEMYEYRVVQGHFNSMVAPVKTRIGVALADVAAVYDIIAGRRVEAVREDDRLYFTADFANVEGRVFALLPEAVAGARLHLPETITAGAPLPGRFSLHGASGDDLGVLGLVRIEMIDAQGESLGSWDRTLPASGALEDVVVPAVSGALRVRISDMVAGFVAEARVQVTPPPRQLAAPAEAVTVDRGDAIHAALGKGSVTVAYDAGRLAFDDDVVTIAEANPQADRDRAWAEQVAGVLRQGGVQVQVASTQQLATARLYAHPWTGRMAGARTRHTVPNIRIPTPVLLVGDAAASPILRDMERSWVAGRSIGRDQAGPGRAVLTFAPQAFDPEADAVILATADEAGLRAALPVLADLVRRDPGPDPTWTAREAVRFAWLPAEVALHKRLRDVAGLPPQRTVARDDARVVHEAALASWPGFAEQLGQAAVVLDVSAAGVAVGTKSWDSPTVMVDHQGQERGRWGGGAEVTPRDVGISHDGALVWAGYSLMGRTAAYRPGQGRVLKHVTPIVHSSNPFGWDSYKESDRHLGMSPDNRVALVPLEGGMAAFDAASGEQLWRIPGTSVPGRHRGGPHPEIAFSPDGRLALISPSYADGEQTVSFTVRAQRWDAERNRYDRRNHEDREVTVRCRVVRRDVRLVEVATGRSVWEQPVEWSLVDVETGHRVWQLGDRAEIRVHETATSGSWHTWQAAEDADDPVDARTGRDIEVPDLLDRGMWHLYSTVGPDGAWSVLGAREAHFLLLDETGSVLRRFEERHLPSELDQGQEIPPTLLAGRNPNRMVLFTPQARAAFVMRLEIGDAATRQRARDLGARNRRIMTTIRSELRNTRNYRNYGDQEYRAAFAERIAGVPEDLLGELLQRMSRIPAERRAGRRRDFRFFGHIVERIEQRLFELSVDVFDAAVNLDEQLRIDVDAMISDMIAEPDLGVLYLAAWDGTIRAISADDGRELWRSPVIGGCRLGALRDDSGRIIALYAAGSRGDLHRLNPSNGQLQWRINVGSDGQ